MDLTPSGLILRLPIVWLLTDQVQKERGLTWPLQTTGRKGRFSRGVQVLPSCNVSFLGNENFTEEKSGNNLEIKILAEF